MINVNNAKVTVKAMLPLKLLLNGKNGINPITLLIQIKKNKVNKNGI